MIARSIWRGRLEARSLAVSLRSVVVDIGRAFRSPLAKTVVRHVLTMTAVILIVCAATYADDLGGGDIVGNFRTLPQTVANVVQYIMRTLLIVGGAIIGGKAMMGSRETGHHVTLYLVGAAFAIFAGASDKLWNMASSLFGH